jgi:putative peptidoglycan lipid II flippase
MQINQAKNSALLIGGNTFIHLANFLKQIILAYFLGVSSEIDLLLLAQIVPTIIQAMIGGGAGEILVIKSAKPDEKKFEIEPFYLTFFFLLILIVGCLYLMILPFWTGILKLDIQREHIFWVLNIIFTINLLPGLFTSVLRPYLYSKGLYKFYTVSTGLSQIFGIIVILVLVGKYEIFSFALGIMAANLLNAFWYLAKVKINFRPIFNFGNWIRVFDNLIVLIKRVFSLSLQTLLNHLTTFWERTLSVKFLTGGYLSSLNYSKTLVEIPNTILLSSVLTTTYIEQANLEKNNQEEFVKYTRRMYQLFLNFGVVLQTLQVIFSPLIIILLFRRGKFDNNAVINTLNIFQILILSFIPKLLSNFLTRTLYILSEYGKLLLAFFLRFLLQVLLMILLINKFSQTIPVVIVIGFWLLSVLFIIFVSAKIKEISLIKFFITYAGSLILGVAIIAINNKLLPYYLYKSTLYIFLYHLPIMLLCLTLMYYYFRQFEFFQIYLTKISKAIRRKIYAITNKRI